MISAYSVKKPIFVMETLCLLFRVCAEAIGTTDIRWLGADYFLKSQTSGI
jgi:hypothetical protein